MEEVCFLLPGHGDVALRNMNNLRSQQHFCDITIVASGRQAFRGHKVVLAACSPFLRDQFLLNPSSELQVSVLHSATVVCKLLQSCYTGKLKFHPKDIVNYLTAASYLQMEHIVEKCRGALSMYMQPRHPSPHRSMKMEESSLSMSVESGLAERMSSPQSHSPEASHHTDTLQAKSRASMAATSQEDVDGGDTFEVLQIRIKDDGDQSPEQIHEIDDEIGEAVILSDGCLDSDPGGGGGGGGGPQILLDSVRGGVSVGALGLERDGGSRSTWRRRLLEPRSGRGGRGFRHRRRGGSALQNRRAGTVTVTGGGGGGGVSYQEAWRFPSPAEIMALGGDLSSAFQLSGHHGGGGAAGDGSPPRMQYGLGEGPEGMGEEQGAENMTVRYGLDDGTGDGSGGAIDMVAVPGGGEEEDGGTGAGGGGGGASDDSVAVVGSTSCASGPVACDHCGLAFPSAQSLLVHIRAAHLPYVCPCCGKQFTHASNLNRHMSVHRGAKVHRCPLCHKTFTQKATLCDHMNLHSGERPHRCAYCHVRFAHKPALRRHLKEQHGKTTAQNCMEAQRESEAVAAAVATGGGDGGIDGGGGGGGGVDGM
ncbi:zinc finger and BTB domain-containing protein 12-like isoform X2 [Engraulis encrasicolus]|uniref:zinc finger and BTB domain-containing protein 12-like isoform X2 n=1 Tax=Engraulis encrasicolus TaxID=184585 RepID=UPI002FD57918